MDGSESPDEEKADSSASGGTVSAIGGEMYSTDGLGDKLLPAVDSPRGGDISLETEGPNGQGNSGSGRAKMSCGVGNRYRSPWCERGSPCPGHQCL